MNLLQDYTLTHNLEVCLTLLSTGHSQNLYLLQVGTLNRTGKLYLGSYDIWTRNRIALLVDLTANVM